MKLTADTITDEHLRELRNLASFKPDEFLAAFPPPGRVDHASWRLSVVDDCTEALGEGDAHSLSFEENARLNYESRVRCANILNARIQ